MIRKPNSNAVLPHLPEEQKKELIEWLLDDGISCRAAVVTLQEKFGVTTNRDAVSNFYQDFCLPLFFARRAAQVGTSNAVIDEARATPGNWTEASLENLGQLAFEMSMRPGVDPKDIKAIFTLVLKAVDQKGKEEDRKLDREKFEEAKKQRDDAKTVVGDDTLTAEQKQQRLKNLFGMG